MKEIEELRKANMELTIALANRKDELFATQAMYQELFTYNTELASGAELSFYKSEYLKLVSSFKLLGIGVEERKSVFLDSK